MTLKTIDFLLLLFLGTDMCSVLSLSEDESASVISNHALTSSTKIPDLSKSRSPQVVPTKGLETPNDTPESLHATIFLFHTLLKAPTTDFPEMQFETKATDPPKLLLSGLIASLDFVDDRVFEELRLEVPRKLGNETTSNDLEDDHSIEELRLDDPRRQGNATASDHSFADNNHFEEIKLHVPNKIGNKTASDFSFADDNHFEELRLDIPNKVDNETASLNFADDNLFEELSLDDPSRLGNETVELMFEADNPQTNKGLLANIIEMEGRKTVAKRTHKKHSALFYGKVTSTNPAYKYLYPAILGICLLTTFALVVALIRKQRRIKSQMSNASCLLLIAVAVTDAMTMGFALAEVGYRFKTTEENNGFLPFEACKTMLVLERVSAIPHASSTWMTVILAVQRYLCVSRPFSAGKYIKVKSVWIYIMFVCFLTILFHVYRFFDLTFLSVIVSFNNVTATTCYARHAAWITDPHVYESIFTWSRIFLMQILPSLMIASFVILMIRSLQKATLKIKSMNEADNKLNTERRKLTFFVAIIALIVFCVETTSGLFLSFNAWELTTGQTLIPHAALKTAAVVFDLMLYISYFLVFLLYCLMSKELRNRITRCCVMRIMLRGTQQRASGKSVTSTSRVPSSTTGSCHKGNGPIKSTETFKHHSVTKL